MSQEDIPTNTPGPKYRAVTEHYRQRIKRGELKPGTKLASAQELARAWKTNPATIQTALTPLVREGLLERTRRRGTFVRGAKTKLATVAIYYGGPVLLPGNEFYHLLQHHLEQTLKARKIEWRIFTEERPFHELFEPMPELRRAIEQREVQGVVGVLLSIPVVSWLNNLPVPVAKFGGSGVSQNLVEILDLVLARMVTDRCRTVGALSVNSGSEWSVALRILARRHNLKTEDRWLVAREAGTETVEKTAYNLFKEFWAQPTRPDGLFVYPDIVCRGMMTAALELGVKIPRDIRVIMHENKGIDYVCPWKVPFLVTDVEEVARVLVDYLEAQFRQGSLIPPSVPARLRLP